MAIVVMHVAGSAWAGFALMAGLAVVLAVGATLEKRMK